MQIHSQETILRIPKLRQSNRTNIEICEELKMPMRTYYYWVKKLIAHPVTPTAKRKAGKPAFSLDVKVTPRVKKEFDVILK